VDKIPALAILGEGGAKDYGIRLYGIPSGYEFSSLIEDILLVGKGKPELSQRTLDHLASLTEPVHIQVYVTPT
jgi:alkyl hydroperoxide reductase subunit AhpF